jgi:hypothetical protein
VVSVNATLPSKELAALQRRFKKGYSVEPQGNSHFVVLDPEGNKVMRPNGQPLSLTSTPRSGSQAAKHAERELREAGVLRETPVKAKASRTVTPEQEAQKSAYQETVAHANARRRGEAAARSAGGTARPSVASTSTATRPTWPTSARWIAREDGDPTLTPDLKHLITRGEERGPDRGAQREGLAGVGRAAEQRRRCLQGALRAAGEGAEHPRPGRPDAVPAAAALGRVAVQRAAGLAGEAIDHAYQRPQVWSFVRKHAQIFDPTLVGAIDTPTGEGATRSWTASNATMMRLVGKTTCWPPFYVGLTARLEAWFFIHKNKNRKNIMPMDIFKAIEGVTRTPPRSRRSSAATAISCRSRRPRLNDERNIASVAALRPPNVGHVGLGAEGDEHHNPRPTAGQLRADHRRDRALLYSGLPLFDTVVLNKAITPRSPEWLLAKSAEFAKTGGGMTRARQMRFVLMTEYNRVGGRNVAKLKLA